MNLSHFLLFFSFIFKKVNLAKSVSFGNNPKDLITISVINQFGIKYCIYINNHNNTESDLIVLKKFSARGTTANIFNYDDLFAYMVKGVFPNAKKIIVVKDKNLFTISKYLQKLDSIGLLHRIFNFIWLVFVEPYENPGDYGKYLSIPYNCRFIISFPINGTTYKLMEVYKAKNQTFSTELGMFQNKKITINNGYLYLTRMNLNKTVLEMNIDSYQPLNIMLRIRRWWRQFEVLESFAKRLNLCYDYQAVKRSNTGKIDTYKDLYGPPLPFHTHSFSTDFVGPMFQARINWYITYPKSERKADYYIQPFHPTVWACILGIILLGGLCGVLIKIKLSTLPAPENISIFDFVFHGFEVFCDQIGCIEDFKTSSFRLLSISFRLAASFVLPSYGSVITSFLTVKILDIPFENLDEFANNGKYVLEVRKGDLLEDYLRDSKDDINRYVYHNLSWVHSEELGLPPEFHKKFCHGQLAYTFLDDDIREDYWAEYHQCKIFKIKKPVTFFYWGTFLGPNSPFKEVLNYNLNRLHTAGIVDKLQKLTEDESSILATEENNGFEPMKLNQMAQVIAIVGIGMMCAVIILFLELCMKIAMLKMLQKMQKINSISNDSWDSCCEKRRKRKIFIKIYHR